MRILAPTAAIALALVSNARAAERIATSDTFAVVFQRANDGDVLRLKGPFDLLVLQDRSFKPALRINAEGATFRAIVVKNVEGLEWTGGAVNATRRPGVAVANGRNIAFARLAFQSDGTANGVDFRDSRDVSVLDSSFQRPRSGVTLATVDGARIVGNRVTGWSADAFGLNATSNSILSKNSCIDPIRVDPDIHIDCIQGYYSSKTPNRDLTITSNYIKGFGTQGIFFNSNPGWPPPERITITDNTILTGDAPNGVLLQNDPAGDVRNNRTSTMPGSRWPTAVRVMHPNTRRCGNRADAYGKWRRETDQPCKRR